jgi:hypothetical protein
MLTTFRITSATIALFPVDEDHHEAHLVPAGAIVAAERIDEDKLIEVTWDGKKILMFAQDIRSRGERVIARQPY